MTTHRELRTTPSGEGFETARNRMRWAVASRYHRLRRYLSPEYVNPPEDPFAIVDVDPDRIVEFTRREYPAWVDAWELFGASVGGDWDSRDTVPVDDTYEGTGSGMYLADRFSETMLHESLQSHFREGVPWEETPFVNECLARVRDDRFEGHIWNRCTSVADVGERCRSIDKLYESIKESGCRSVRERNAERGYPMSFRSSMTNEILVDVGRDGELLFVNGRHRLSIAKILRLDEIPVAKLVYHEDRDTASSI